jgi:RNA polymerase sigma-70 factor (ECF subfamily)
MTAAQASFLELLEKHKGILYKVTSAYCRDREDRHDLVQEIALQLWRSFHRYDGRSRFSTWMYRIAMNIAISHYRTGTTRIRETLPIEDDILQVASASQTDGGDDTRILYELIGALDEVNRALIILYLDGHSYDEIAETMGLTPTNVATRINRIKQRLRDDYREKER